MEFQAFVTLCGEREESDEGPVELEEHREDSEEEKDEYEELRVKSGEWREREEAGGGLYLTILTSWTVFSSV